MCPTASLFLDDDSLKAAFYETMAQVSHSIAEVKEKHYSLPIRLWRAERSLRDFVNNVNTRKPTFGKFAKSTIEDSIDKLYSLHRSVEDLWLTSQRKGLTNRTMYAGSLLAMRKHSDEFLILPKNLQLLLDPRTRESLDRARDNIFAVRLLALNR